MNVLLQTLGSRIGRYLTQPIRGGSVGKPSTASALLRTLIPGDVLLIEGDLRISQAIKYLTQSSWSHAALFVGEQAGLGVNAQGEKLLFVEADLIEGVRACPLREYSRYHSRICRAHQLTPTDCNRLIRYITAQLGRQYNLKHVFDLARYLLPIPVPTRWRRSMIGLGSGDPTKAICSSLIAEGFQHIHYPILPYNEEDVRPSATEVGKNQVFLHIGRDSTRTFKPTEERLFFRRNALHFVPRDFDVSPYFEVVKPTLALGFNYQDIVWAKEDHVHNE
jgi:hypothetical protein